MMDLTLDHHDGPVIDVVLEGGPPEMPAVMRVPERVSTEGKLKIPHCGGYEHFERAAGEMPEEARPLRFRWTMRTKVAE